MVNQRSSAVPLHGMTASTTYRRDLVEKVLGKPGKYPAYFRVYDELFDVGRAAYVAEHQSQHDPDPINHAAILTATERLKADSTLSLQEVRGVLAGDLQIQSKLRIDSIIALATQAMLMADVNIRAQHMPNYSLGNYYRPEWRDNQSLIEFITSCFVKVSPTQEGNVAHVLEDKSSLAAGSLSSRVGLKFKGTNNIAEHLLLDTENLTLYFFHHAEYIRAHLGSWGGINSAKTASLEECLKKGTLWPALLAETLRSTQSILFCYNDRTSMNILRTAVDKQKLDPTCLIHEGYRMFDDSDEDLPYAYWGQRLIDLHKFFNHPQPRTKFQRWIQWRTTESNSFLIAMLALVITIIVGIITLGLTAIQVWISWQAWKHPVESSQ